MRPRLSGAMRSILYILGAFALFCVLLFVVATRTKAVQEALGKQLEAQFAATYHGTLEVGLVAANLRRQFFISDLRFLDEEGQVWLMIDSVVATPRWNALLRKRFDVRSIKVLRPVLTLHYAADRSLRAPPFLRHRKSGAGNAWQFESVGVTLEEGTVTSRVPESSAATPWLDELMAATITGLNAQARIAWGPGLRRLDVESLESMFRDLGLTLRIQAEMDAGTVHVRAFDAKLGSSQIRGSGSIEVDAPQRTRSWKVALEESTLDGAQLRRVFPVLPVDSTMKVSGRVRGYGGTTEIESMALIVGNSVLHMGGAVRGQDDSVRFAIDLDAPLADPADIAAHIPAVALPAWMAASSAASFTLSATGAYAAGAVQLSGAAQGRALGGAFSAAATVAARADSATTYRLELQGDSLLLPLHSVVSGTAELAGAGTHWESLDVVLSAAVHSSQVAGQAVDTVMLDATMAGRQAALTAEAKRKESSLRISASAAWPEASPRYALSFQAENLDLGSLLGQDSVVSSVTGSLDVAGEGTTWDVVQGEALLDISAAQLHRADESWMLPAHMVRASVRAPHSTQPRLEVDGDLIQATVRGDTDFGALQSLGALWTNAAHDAVMRQATKRYAQAGRSADLSLMTWPPPDQVMQQDEASTALAAAALDRVALDVDVQVKQAETLRAWLNVFPSVPRTLDNLLRPPGGADVHAPRAAIRLEANAAGLWLRGTGSDALGSAAHIDLRAGLQAPLEETLDVTINMKMPHYRLWGMALVEPEAHLRMQRSVMHMHVDAAADDRIGPVALDATVRLLQDRYRITLNDGLITVGGQPWHMAAGRTVDVFWDGAMAESLAIAQAGTQRVTLSGVVSRSSGSNVSAQLESLSLHQISALWGMRRPLGGFLDGTLQWSEEAGLTGHATVDTLAFGDRTLGRLVAHSHITPGSPDVVVEAVLHPLHFGGEASSRAKHNDIRVRGAVRLGGENNAGGLNLALDIARLDAFVLEELINAVDSAEGAFTGRGTVTGTLRQPVFQADLDFAEGRFTIPAYNLAFETDGAIRVDAQGVHVRDLVLSDSTGGSAVLSGTLLFNDYRFLSFDVAGVLDELQIMNVSSFTRDLSWYGTVWASGDVSLAGPLNSAFLRSNNIVTSPRSEIYIPIREGSNSIDPGFIIYKDPDDMTRERGIVRRTNILARRPATERQFGAGLEMDLNIEGPPGSTIKLVIDPLLGDVITGIGSARVQLQLQDGDMATYGTFDVTSGDYLFTAGDLFVRRFLIDEGVIRWAGDPLDPVLDIQAEYLTRASRSGLPEELGGALQTSLPLMVDLHITGALNAVQVDLGLALDQRREAISDTPLLEAYLNQPDHAAQHASSVLLTNSFLLSAEGASNDVLAGSALNSVSQLVTSHLNRYLSQVIPNADVALGVLSDESAEDLDLSAGIALRLLDERLLVRGHGIYRGQVVDQPGTQAFEGEFVVEIKFSPTVSVDLFYRREGDVLSETLITSETGVGLNFRTQFSSWRGLWESVFRGDGSPPDSADVPLR